MFFKNLPDYIKKEIIKLASDDEFQERFGSDKRLDEIDEMKINMVEEHQLLQLLLKNTLTINDKIFKALTPVIWSYLWVIESPFVKVDKNVSNVDVDIFFYLLEHGVGDLDPVRITSESLQFTSRSIQISYEDAVDIIYRMIRLSFKPLSMFPKTTSSEENFYDADFLTALIAKVHSVTGYTPEYILNEMSMTAVCYYFVQVSRLNGSQNIKRQTPEEILIMQDYRASELVIDRLIEKGVIQPEEREKYLKIITTPYKNK